jgi:site-specific recombinase
VMITPNQFQEKIKKARQIFSRSKSDFGLNDLLCQKVVTASLPEKMNWFEEVLRWLFNGSPAQDETRFRFFFQALEKNPEWKENFQQTFTALLKECHFLSLFTQTGLAVDHGLWGDVAARLMDRIAPTTTTTEFQDLLLRAFPNTEKADRWNALSPETLQLIQSLIYFPENQLHWQRLSLAVDEALLFLAVHISHYGMSFEIRSRLIEPDEVSRLSFFKLARSVQNEDSVIYESTLVACETDVANVYASMEENGVSVDVVNRLETISALLLQIRNLLKLRNLGEMAIAPHIRDFFIHSLLAGIRRRSVLGHVRHHFYLLSRKIVERNGHSGEHYIARSGAESWILFRSALGGGLIVVLMTVLKTRLMQSQPAPFFLASGIWIIYSAGFLSMQFSGATLATKIPSFTASRLAGILKTVRKLNAESFGAELKVVLRSQLLALLGNLMAVIPFALLLNYFFQKTFGNNGLMDEHYSQHVLHDLHPLLSFAVPLGALTGLQLWLSSVAGGWFENWIVFRRVPDSIRNHFRFRKIFGAKAAENLADWILKNSSGVSTNITLAFLFGFVPLLGTLFGANWNGNHVTISTAGATFAVSAQHFDLSSAVWVEIGIGLFLIATMNFLVSFGLALYVAGNSQKMKFWRVLHYLRSGWSSKES